MSLAASAQGHLQVTKKCISKMGSLQLQKTKWNNNTYEVGQSKSFCNLDMSLGLMISSTSTPFFLPDDK